MTILDRLERFMATYSHTTVSLNPPASPEQIEAAESAMGVKLPADLRAAYRRFNGVKREEFSAELPARPRGPSLFVHTYDWVDLDHMVTLWRMMKDMAVDFKASGIWQDVPDSKIPPHLEARPVDWDRKWIPIGDHGTFDRVYVDLAPAKVGVRGQIVYAGRRGPVVSAISFNSYLERLLNGFDSGKLVLDRDGLWWTPTGAVVTKLADAGA